MKRDDLIFELIEKEHQRQLKGIELIASENFVSDQVMQAMGSCLTNAPKAYSAPNTPTYSRTPVHKPMQPYSSPCSIRATNSWD